MRGRVSETYPMLTDLHLGRMEAIRLGVPQEYPLLHSGRRQLLHTDQSAAALDRPYILQGGSVMGTPIEGIDCVEILEASPL